MGRNKNKVDNYVLDFSFSSRVRRFVSSRLFLYGTMIWFVAQSFVLAVSTKIGIPPDENYHIAFIRLFSDSGVLPFIQDQTGYYQLGEAMRTPFFLYHYLMSFPYRFFEEWDFSLFLLRFINIGIAILTLYCVIKLANAMKVSAFVRNISLFMLVNTLMFVFISASVSYDNLFILFSVLLVLHLVKLSNKFTLNHFLIFAVVSLAGLLVKINFLSIAFVCWVVLVALNYKSLGATIQNLIKEKTDKKSVYLLVLLLLLGSLAVVKYGGNIIKYGDFAPSCTRVHTLEQCRASSVFVRNENLANSASSTTSKQFVEYFFDWSLRMQKGVHGILTAREFIKPFTYVFIGLQVIFIVGVISVVRKIKKRDKHMVLLLVVSSFYLATLFFKNYSIYGTTGLFDLAVQGRYALATVPLLYLVFNHYTFKLFNKKWMGLLIIFIFIVFFNSSFVTYLRKTDYTWHTSTLQSVNSRIKRLLSQ